MKLPRYLTIEEVKEMFNHAWGRDSVILYILFYLGLRNNELRNLRIEDIDFINSTAKIVQGKGKKDRYIPIPKPLIQPLKDWIGNKGFGYVIEGRSTNRRISNRHINRIVKSIAVITNIRNPTEIHPHTLRHSYATFLLNNDADLIEIKELLGHSNIIATQVYTHLSHKKLQNTIEKVFQ